MCTIVILRRPGHAWPLILAANRDEMRDRPWRPPGRHWPERPQIVAGCDALAGGSWLGLNDDGVVAGVLNRIGSLGPTAGKRSRGELVLQALEHDSADRAAEALAAVPAADYRSFNLLLADRERAFWLRNQDPDGPGGIEVRPVPEGLSMLTAYDLNDQQSPRIAANLARFTRAMPPDPASGEWSDWTDLLRRRSGADPAAAMNVGLASGFQTVSSSLIALPSGPETGGHQPVWLFAPGRPDEHDYRPVDLAGGPASDAASAAT